VKIGSQQRRFMRLLSLFNSESGQSIVESSLSMLMIITSALALFELCMLAYTSGALSEAAHEGLRFAIVNGSDAGVSASGCSTSSPSAVISTVTVAATKYNLGNASSMTVNVCYPATGAAPGSLVTVTVSYPYTPFTSILGFQKTLTASTEGRILY
jgi:hypothetical protein